jgi:hypothetical protein
MRNKPNDGVSGATGTRHVRRMYQNVTATSFRLRNFMKLERIFTHTRSRNKLAYSEWLMNHLQTTLNISNTAGCMCTETLGNVNGLSKEDTARVSCTRQQRRWCLQLPDAGRARSAPTRSQNCNSIPGRSQTFLFSTASRQLLGGPTPPSIQ